MSLTSFVASWCIASIVASVLESSSLGSRSLSTSIALGSSCRSLVNDLYRWLGFLVRVFIVVVAYISISVSRVGISRVDWVFEAIPRSSYAFYRHQVSFNGIYSIDTQLFMLQMHYRMAASQSWTRTLTFEMTDISSTYSSASREGLATEGTIRRGRLDESRRTGS